MEAFTNLTELNLSRTGLTNVPSFIFNNKNLTKLDLGFNPLDDLASLDVFKSLKKLERLIFWNDNKFTMETINDPNKITKLDLSFCQLHKISPILGLNTLLILLFFLFLFFILKQFQSK